MIGHFALSLDEFAVGPIQLCLCLLQLDARLSAVQLRDDFTRTHGISLIFD